MFDGDLGITQYFINDRTVTVYRTKTNDLFRPGETVRTFGFSLPYNSLNEQSRRYVSFILDAVKEQIGM